MAKKYKLQHGEFEINYEPLCGMAMYPDRLCADSTEEFWVWINPDRCKKEIDKLDTLIHELLHCEHPNMSEEEVLRTATHLATVLIGEGWTEKKKKK